MENIKITLDFLQSFLWVSLFWFLVLSWHKPLRHLLETLNEVMKERGVKVTRSGLEISSSKNNTKRQKSL